MEGNQPSSTEYKERGLQKSDCHLVANEEGAWAVGI